MIPTPVSPCWPLLLYHAGLGSFAGSSVLRPIPMHRCLPGPVPRQDPIWIGVRVIGLIARLARTVYPCVVVRARHFVDLTGVWVQYRLLIQCVIDPVGGGRAPCIH